MRTLVALGLVFGVLLAGCQQSSDLSPTDDKAMRDNMTRPLTQEEIAQASGGASKEAVPEGAVAPPPKKGE